MEKITLQTIFNAAWQKFIVEDADPGVQHDGWEGEYKCVYNDGRGNCCAVGLALKEFELSDEDQTRRFGSLVAAHPDLFNISDEEYDNLNVFQRGLHDELVDLSSGKWRIAVDLRAEKYEKIAEKFRLTVPE